MNSQPYTQEALIAAQTALGWDIRNDNLVVEIGGTSVSGIDVGEVYNEKWQSPIGTRKYNKDAFIVIKNLSRTPFAPSVNDDPERTAHHRRLENSDQRSDSNQSPEQSVESA
ncbi:hypothetical protein [Synechococcus phage S-M1]|uniref:Uncharacterized protein n=1 Tax=Synechococcus phage QB2 TaxID=3159453 RepID=A0AAU8EHS6_9CAUD|nr:hypothetical protein [Synechococcus phage S-M1]